MSARHPGRVPLRFHADMLSSRCTSPNRAPRAGKFVAGFPTEDTKMQPDAGE